MKILAFDTATPTLSVAIWDDKIIYYSFLNHGLTHSETLLPQIVSALSICGFTIRDIDRIAVTIGPGSFTGLRIGASTAKGLAFAGDIPCVAVSTLEAMAHGSNELCRPEPDILIVPVLDARRGQVYTAAFKDCGKERLCRVWDDRVILHDSLLCDLAGQSFMFVESEGSIQFTADSKPLGFGKMSAACGGAMIASVSTETVSADLLETVYLRKP